MNRYKLKHHIQIRKYFLGFDKLFVQNQLGCTVSDNQCKEVTREDSDFFFECYLKLSKSHSDCNNIYILLLYEEEKSYFILILSR
jgi:hypothetical protein